MLLLPISRFLLAVYLNRPSFNRPFVRSKPLSPSQGLYRPSRLHTLGPVPTSAQPRRNQALSLPRASSRPVSVADDVFTVRPIMQTPPHPSDSHPVIWRVYWTPELLTQILEACEWPALMEVSRANRYGRDAVQVVVEYRLRRLVEPYIATRNSSNNFSSFIETLDKLGGGVLGSIARRLLAVNAPFLNEVNEKTSLEYDSSFDLNIVVPLGQIEAIVNWFTQNGWGDWQYRLPASGYRRNVLTFVTAKKDVGDDKVGGHHDNFRPRVEPST